MPALQAELSDDGTCVLRDGDAERWRVSLSVRDDASWNPFREAIVWSRAHRVVVGSGDRVHLLDLDTGTRRAPLHVGSSRTLGPHATQRTSNAMVYLKDM